MTLPVADTSIPEIITTVNIYNQEIIATQALTLTVDNSGPATSNKTISLQIIDSTGAPAAGNFEIKVWFVDTNDKDAQRSVNVPTVPGSPELNIVTEDDGSKVITVSNTDPLNEWYVCAKVLGFVFIDGPLNLGV